MYILYTWCECCPRKKGGGVRAAHISYPCTTKHPCISLYIIMLEIYMEHVFKSQTMHFIHFKPIFYIISYSVIFKAQFGSEYRPFPLPNIVHLFPNLACIFPNIIKLGKENAIEKYKHSMWIIYVKLNKEIWECWFR